MGRVLVQLPGTTTAKALTETLSKNVLIVDEDLNQLRLHDGVTAGGHLIGNSAGSGVPVGTIIPFAGNSVPQGYLLCDGSAISRTTYASLFAVIGTIYGAGDGSTTFNLPNGGIRLLTTNTLKVDVNSSSALYPQMIKLWTSSGAVDNPSGVRVIYCGNNNNYMYRTTSGSPTGIGTGASGIYISPQLPLSAYNYIKMCIKY